MPDPPPRRFHALKILTLALAASLLAIAHPAAAAADESGLRAALQSLHDEWSVIFYQMPEDQQAAKFENLLARVHAITERHPESAEPLVLEAIVLCTYAGADIGFGVLSKVKRARKLLERSIDIDPKAMEGSAYVALGNLYHRLPGWPISFGDDEAARRYFEAAQKMFPKAIDTNYFLGDFLLSAGQYEQALRYLELADRAEIRPDSRISDLKLKEEIAKALADARARNDDRSDFFSQFIPSFGDKESVP